MPIPAIITAAAFPALLGLALRFLVGTLIARTVTAFGIAIFSFTATSFVIDRITGYLTAIETGATGIVAEVASMIGLFECIMIILSAYIAATSIRQLRGVFNNLIFGRS